MATDTETTKASKGHPMSLEVASRLFDWSSIALAIGACIVFVATAAIVWLGIVKEHHWDALREQANEKIASVELDAAKSNAEAAKANERIAELSIQAEGLKKDTANANARAAEANLKAETERAERLKLELRLAPRSIIPQQLMAHLSGLAGLRVDLVAYETGGQDVAALAGQIRDGFNSAGMTTHVFTPFADGTVVKGILVRCSDDAPDDTKAAVSRIIAALGSVGLGAGPWAPFPANEPPSGAYNGPNGVAPDAKIRVLIGAKP